MVAGDFFKDDWSEKLNIESKGGFDFVYDYTVSPFYKAFAIFSAIY